MGKEIQTARSKATAAAVKSATAPPMAAGADTKTKLDAAKQAMDRKEYATAEDIYKQVVAGGAEQCGCARRPGERACTAKIRSKKARPFWIGLPKN